MNSFSGKDPTHRRRKLKRPVTYDKCHVEAHSVVVGKRANLNSPGRCAASIFLLVFFRTIDGAKIGAHFSVDSFF